MSGTRQPLSGHCYYSRCQFAGGGIDFLQKTLAENEAGQVRQERLTAEQTAVALRNQLTTLTGLANLGMLVLLSADTCSAP